MKNITTNETTADQVIKLMIVQLKQKTSQLEVFNAVHVFEDANEFYTSEDLQKRFKNIQGLCNKIKTMKKFVFIRAYVMENGKIYHLYLYNDLQILKEVCPYTSMSKQGFFIAVIFDDSFIIDSRTCYGKSKQNFDYFKTTHQTIF